MGAPNANAIQSAMGAMRSQGRQLANDKVDLDRSRRLPAGMLGVSAGTEVLGSVVV